MRKLLAFALVLAAPGSALAWNEKGHLVTARLVDGGDQVLCEVAHAPRGLAAPVQDIGLSARVERQPDGRCRVEVTARRSALFVQAELDGHEAETGLVHLWPGATRTLSIALYDQVQDFNYAAANRTAGVLLLFSVVTLLAIYWRRADRRSLLA